MSTAIFDNPDSADGGNVIQYRAVPAGAILGLLLGVFSVVILFAAAYSLESCLLVTPLPVAGILLSLFSRSKIRRDPDVYTGGKLASAGVAFSALFLVSGVGYGVIQNVTEVPPDHTRISFNTMRPDVVQERAGVIVPPDVQALDGKRVFIKGYMRPPEVKSGISRFLLVRDNNQCCFGDISSVKYYDRILVDLSGSLRLNYSDGLFSISGVLKVMPQNVNLGPQAPVFAMQVDHAK